MLISCSLIDDYRDTLNIMEWHENAQVSYFFFLFVDTFIKCTVLGAGAKNVTSPFLVELSMYSVLTRIDVKLPLR